MPARKRKTRGNEEPATSDPKRQRAWMLEQKKKEEEAAEVEKQEEADKESENDSGMEEGDGPLEDWTRKELADECKTLGLSDKGVKAVLIARIKEAKASTEPAVEEAAVGGAAVGEEAVGEEAVGDEAVGGEAAGGEGVGASVAPSVHPSPGW